jgi:hypothetical protein
MMVHSIFTLEQVLAQAKNRRARKKQDEKNCCSLSAPLESAGLRHPGDPPY